MHVFLFIKKRLLISRDTGIYAINIVDRLLSTTSSFQVLYSTLTLYKHTQTKYCTEKVLYISPHCVRIKSAVQYMHACLFVLRLNVPVNNFSVMSGRKCMHVRLCLRIMQMNDTVQEIRLQNHS